jgi:adenylate cyclase
LDKFLGDGLLALFNVPVRQQDYAWRSVQTALQKQEAHQGVLRSWEAFGRNPLPIGIGIATGEAISGNFGGP